ncbi:MAG TPA: lytic transglycosylase domain-containing protein [Candidatus Acidoferrum sp.]|nr:lytic transglycosylase domain-containing protein [Candidatus Acidoferrum sp.]
MRLAREALRSNPRLAPVDALLLSTRTLEVARRRGISPWFLASTLLQESAFNPGAISAAGAVGIAQFEVPTARLAGIDPWNPRSAIDGCAQLLAEYLTAYEGRNQDPYALAAAAYNAGPGAVRAYGGVPPYPETREYIALILERWSRIVGR